LSKHKKGLSLKRTIYIYLSSIQKQLRMRATTFKEAQHQGKIKFKREEIMFSGFSS
jgi:hypothetical protein